MSNATSYEFIATSTSTCTYSKIKRSNGCSNHKGPSLIATSLFKMFLKYRHDDRAQKKEHLDENTNLQLGLDIYLFLKEDLVTLDEAIMTVVFVLTLVFLNGK